MKRIAIISLVNLVVILFGIEKIAAQISFQKSIGGTGADYGYELEKTTDNGYISIGTTNSFGAGGRDLYLVKTDFNGDLLWTKTYGGAGTDYGYCIGITSDDGYIICGNTMSFGAGGEDVYLIKTDFSGNALWSKTYGSTGDETGFSVQQTTDGGYVIIGNTYSAAGYDFHVIKTDVNGDTLWTKTVGGPGDEISGTGQQTSDGGYIIVGTTSSYGSGGYDICVIKTDITGAILWTKTYGGTGDDNGYRITQTNDGGYLVTGAENSFSAGSYDGYLLKIDVNGAIQWTRSFGGPGWDDGVSVKQTPDGGYIVYGQSYSFGINSDLYLLRTDAAGDTLWTKAFGGSGYEFGGEVELTNDGGYIFNGGEQSFGAAREFYLVKTDANGDSGCNERGTGTIMGTPAMLVSNPVISVFNRSDITGTPATLTGSGGVAATLCINVSVGLSEAKSNSLLDVYPNPFSNELIVKGTKDKGVLILFDLMGKEVMRQQALEDETKFEVKDLAPGFYFLKCIQEDKTVDVTLVKF
ncbi:MAG: T9SS type A sorting domain-containing protein [Bacteroidia bacterium]